MKSLSLFLLLSLSFLPSAPLSAQVNCTTYFGGETSCNGPRGYHAEGRQYFGGVESWYDNRGNTSTVRHHAFGVTTIDAEPRYTFPHGAGRLFNPSVDTGKGRLDIPLIGEKRPHHRDRGGDTYQQMYGTPQPTAYSAKEMEQFETAHRARMAEHAAWQKNYEEVIVPIILRSRAENADEQARQVAGKALKDKILGRKQAEARVGNLKQVAKNDTDLKQQKARASAEMALLDAELDHMIARQAQAKGN
ncbi:hypothetical protein C8R31_104107 [Nitrosospira sp. Nsp2]|uniref:hypothetical protein n=1 Tax=Nitrosospira sp. Nsp2 TaxID=136548 RepID=UPI000D4BDBE5|nr:hypothetical protein [Nitrosospira sp. Nsp2]PTR15080.1 hypothetical protein C8R31_104107 [Nitrosospira sp. Nsp2]